MNPVLESIRGINPSASMAGGSRNLPAIIFTPACQHLPGFHTIPRQTPRERLGLWLTIDF